MEIKEKQSQQEAQRLTNGTPRGRFTRYGAMAAAAMLVVGGVLGYVLASAGRPGDKAATQSAQASDAAEFIEEAPAAALWQTEAAEQAVDSLPDSEWNDTVQPMESYDELYGLIERMQLRDEALYGISRADTAAPAAAEAAGGLEMGAADASTTMNASAETAQSAAEGKQACLAGDYSETNTQVRGVDEADVVKTDGKYIYYVAGSQFNIIDAKGKDTRVLSSTLLGNNDKWWSYSAEIFLSGDRLMIIAQGYATVWTKTVAGGRDEQREQTQVLLYDVSDPTAPKLLSTLGQSGNYVSSRMVGEYVYLVTSQSVWNVAREEPASYVPQLMTGDTAKLLLAGDILVYGEPKIAAYTVIGCINLVNGTDYASAKAVFGSTGEIYCNGAHLLMANSQYDQQKSDIAPDETGKNVQVTTSTSSTKLLLFELDGARVKLCANGIVPGTLINQFAMDEYQDVIRLVTTVSNWTERVYTDGVDTYEYEDQAYNCLYTLDQSLQVLGALENLAENEWIESVRFDGDIGYFVTFRQVDPLFAVDLSNPKQLQLLSALKIPGFSEYLHVFGDRLLLGLGYEADEETGQTKGVKLSMFDTANPRDVKELAHARVDSSWTVVGSNHKAILVNVARNIIAFPADDAYYIYGYTQKDGFRQTARVQMDGDLNSWNLRGLFIGDYFYVVGESGVTVISMNTWEKVAACTISYG